MQKHKGYLVLFILASVILLFSLTSLVGVSKAKFTTEKNVNGFNISTKKVEVVTGAAITADLVQTQPAQEQQPEIVTDPVDSTGEVETTTDSTTIVDTVETPPAEVQQPETVTDPVDSTGEVETTTDSTTIVDTVETPPAEVQQPEAVTEPAVIDN